MRFVKTAESIFDIPSNFTRVEYLESTGTQYIDTGYKPVPATTKFEFYFSPTNISGNYFPFGARPNTSIGSETCTTYFSTGNIRQDWAGLNTYFSKINVGDKVLYTAYNNTVSLNDDSVTGTVVRSTNRLDYNFLLFTVNTNGTADSRRYIGKVYYAKLWDDGVLVRDMIPCIDPLGVACMYDLVGKKPYYNQGTGEFTVGRKIIPVEYLQSSGTQYIDTNTEITPTTTILIDASLESYVEWTNSCGGIPSARGYYCLPFGWTDSNTTARSIYGTDTVGTGEYRFNYTLGKRVKILYNDNKKLYIDDVHVFTFNYNKQTPPSTQIFQFGRHSSACGAKFYGVKIWDNGYNSTLVADYIPCKDENNVGFMFDTLSGTVYENAGTGAFVVGQNKYKMKLRLIKDNVLPTGYTQVEYLESSGTQWIDTGINPDNANTSQVDIETNFAILTPSSDQYIGIFGAAVPRFGFYTRYNNTCFGYYQAHDNVHEIEYGKKYNLRFSVTKGSQNATLDGVTVWSETRTGTLQNTYTIGMFCRNYSTPQWINNARIYDLTIAIDGTLVRNFIPAIDPSGTPCMYDLVSRTPFYNKGTGTFTTGKPVLPIVRFPVDPVPVGYKTVNYIEGTGTQYIDTGYKIDADTKLSLDYQMTDITSGTNGIFGASGTQTLQFLTQISQAKYVFQWTPNSIIYIGTKDTDRHTVILDVPNTNISVDSDTLSMASFTFGYPTGNVMLFANGHLSVKGKMKMYNCQIYDSNTLVRNFIPVVRLLDNKAGMWDTVTKQFYTTPTGDFITG